MPDEHALLSASSAHRWMTCTPSARLEQNIGTEECSVYAEEGTAAHALAEILLSHLYLKTTDDEFDEQMKQWHANSSFEKYYNQEFAEYVHSHVWYVKELTDALTVPYQIFFEVRVNFSNFVPQGFGTADVLIVTDETLYVVDLKFGKGVPVSAKNNPQLRLYALGALNLFPNTQNIQMIINQPRIDNRDTECISKQELLKWARDAVIPAADEAVKGEGALHPTESACRFCKMRTTCKAHSDMLLGEAQREFLIADTRDKFRQLSTDDIGKILSIASELTNWLNEVKSFALGQAIAGVKIPGYKLVESRSKRIITDESAVYDILQREGFTDEELLEPDRLKSLTALEKLVGKTALSELCADYILKQTGALTLAPEEDRRPEVSNYITAASDFAVPIK